AFEDWIFNLPRLLPDAWNRAACPGRIVQRTGIIVSELKKNNVTWLHQCKRVGPVAFGDVSAAAAAADSTIHHIDFRSIEEVDKGLTPSPLPLSAIAMSISNGRIADEKDGWKMRIGRFQQTQLCMDSRIGRRTRLDRHLLR